MPAPASNAETPAGPVGQGDYVVRAGDCIESIAVASGHFWETIWNDGQNAELKQVRGSPNVLLPGDRVHVPPRREKVESCAQEQRHRFRRKGVPSKLQVRFCRADEPRKDEPYRLIVDGVERSGSTDGDGWLREPLAPEARLAVVLLGPAGPQQTRHEFQLGGIDPVTELSGVQQRLINLGYDCEITGQPDEATSGALTAFQQAQGLEETGEPDEATQNKLKETHGG